MMLISSFMPDVVVAEAASIKMDYSSVMGSVRVNWKVFSRAHQKRRKESKNKKCLHDKNDPWSKHFLFQFFLESWNTIKYIHIITRELKTAYLRKVPKSSLFVLIRIIHRLSSLFNFFLSWRLELKISYSQSGYVGTGKDIERGSAWCLFSNNDFEKKII
jgi:hypothetical protein